MNQVSSKTYLQRLTHNNFIVRDHQVHGIRTLPGVALLDMVYRLADQYMGTRSVELHHILFMRPIVTSELFDQQILVTFTPMNQHWKVKVASKKVMNETVIGTSADVNMECLLYPMANTQPVSRPDIASFATRATEQWEMEEMYDSARRCDIRHYTFMKTLGNVYQQGNQEVMKLWLSDLAQKYAEQFYIHAALLDGASMAGLSFSKNGMQNWVNQDGSPYMPISIERFCIYQRSSGPIYTYTEEKEIEGDLPLNPDLVSRDITVYSESGEIIVEFICFSVKRIRNPHLIYELVETRNELETLLAKAYPKSGEVSGLQTEHPWQTSVETGNVTVKRNIERYLRQEMAKVLKVSAESIGTQEGFYELGLDSIELLRLVKTLEHKTKTPMYPTLLFEYSTIERLSDYLQDKYAHAFCEQGSSKKDSTLKYFFDMSVSSRPAIERYLQNEIAGVLHVNPDHIGVCQGFYELGLDSIELLKFVKVLEEKVGETLYPTLLFEYPSVTALAGFLFEHSRPAFRGEKYDDVKPVGQSEIRRPDNPGKTLFFERVWSCEPRQWENRKKGDGQHHLICLFHGSSKLVAWFKEHFNGADRVSVINLDSNRNAPDEQFEDFFGHILELIQEHIRQARTSELLIQIAGDASKDYKAACALEGLLRTASLENPKIHGQIILISHMHSQLETEIAAMLDQEACLQEGGMQTVLYQEGTDRRFVSRLYEQNVPEVLPPYIEHGVYVITGGLGGIGFLVAKHLANHKTKLALIGRSGLDETRKIKIRQLIQKGAEVRYYQTNISEPKKIEETLADIRSHWGRITGVFHTAGIVKDQIIFNKNHDEARKVFQPKIRGTWNLDQATRKDDLTYFILFSSVSAITGNLGQADYASANAWMDSFAWEREARVRQGKCRGQTVTINWPLWLEGGMKIKEDMQELLYSAGGSKALPSLDGLRALDAILTNRSTQMVVLYGDSDEIRNQLRHEITENKGLPLGVTIMTTESEMDNGTGRSAEPQQSNALDIAIVGLSGKYPMSDNMDELYSNLKEGKDCITHIPAERWQHNKLSYEVTELYNYGGFMEGIDEFDPLFFNISASQAEMMDPQARLFLQTAWEACEDAGFLISRNRHHYSASSDKSVGVFAGVFWNNYELFSAEMTQRGTPTAFGVAAASVANMVSYCLNFHGPSIAVDSMCSSSLTAIHLACESIRRGECHYAVAGGVNLVTHPHKYLFLKQAQFLSTDGRCRSFGKDGDGYVPGEGVGAVLLTSLSEAEKEGYPIYGVIKGSAVNHVGKTSGATVPDPVAQSEVIADAIRGSGVDPRTIGYVEAHGTGTSLGDPVEMRGLDLAFGRWNSGKQYCTVGSIKSNIGHLEAASGIAGLSKILLQFKYKVLFPSLHAEQTNPYIDFEHSSFRIQRNFEPWAVPKVEINGEQISFPRRAGISSFGASGSNAHLILEEYIPTAERSKYISTIDGAPVIIPLSAQKEDKLKIIAENLVRFLTNISTAEQERDYTRLKNLAYTLQTGREPMAVRVAFVVADIDELVQKLGKFIHEMGERQGNKQIDASNQSEEVLAAFVCAGNMEGIARLWADGSYIDWDQLYGKDKPHRLSLPTYPFAKERYWVPLEEDKPVLEMTEHFATSAVGASTHPLLRRNLLFVEQIEALPENCWNFAKRRSGRM